jgi:hypothetical protein
MPLFFNLALLSISIDRLVLFVFLLLQFQKATPTRFFCFVSFVFIDQLIFTCVATTNKRWVMYCGSPTRSLRQEVPLLREAFLVVSCILKATADFGVRILCACNV